MDDVFSKLGGLHAMFFSIINLFGPLGMLYFLFNLSFYIKKKKQDNFMHCLHDTNRNLCAKLQEFKEDTMFDGFDSNKKINWSKKDLILYKTIKHKMINH